MKQSHDIEIKFMDEGEEPQINERGLEVGCKQNSSARVFLFVSLCLLLCMLCCWRIVCCCCCCVTWYLNHVHERSWWYKKHYYKTALLFFRQCADANKKNHQWRRRGFIKRKATRNLGTDQAYIFSSDEHAYYNDGIVYYLSSSFFFSFPTNNVIIY